MDDAIISSFGAPEITQRLNPLLLSVPIARFKVETLKAKADWILSKLDSGKYKKFPNTVSMIRDDYKIFMETYERAKIEEEKAKDKKGIKTQWPFYRPDSDDHFIETIYQRLVDRYETSFIRRKNNSIQKVSRSIGE